MNRIRRIISLVLIVCVIMMLGACGNDDKKHSDTVDSLSENASSSPSDSSYVTIDETADGILYAISGKNANVDIVVGNNYFDTQLADWITNFSYYEGKVVEIEGFSLHNNQYYFVSRYSTSSLCAYCPSGYSYFEYEWSGNKYFNPDDLGSEEKWIKVIGVLSKANDGVTDYYYIDVNSIEVMDDFGESNVTN